MSPAGIRRVCAMLAPLVFVTCTLPSRYFSWAARFPYPATQNPTMKSLIPDLYDRFAAPIEERYSKAGARALVEQAGCAVKAVAFIRGWAVWGEKRASGRTSRARPDDCHAVTIASACQEMPAANDRDEQTKPATASPVAPSAGIGGVNSNCTAAAIAMATAMVAITAGVGMRSQRDGEGSRGIGRRGCAPCGHAAVLVSPARIRPIMLSAKALRT